MDGEETMKPELMKHTMIDIETMGTSNNAAIISIGAVKFDIEGGEVGHGFHEVINLQSCLDLGLDQDKDTAKWWSQQLPELVPDYKGTKNHIADVLEQLKQFYRDNNKGFVWGNGATFDLTILDNAYTVAGMNPPWHYTCHRDVRTIVHLATMLGAKKHGKLAKSQAHDALNDAIFQAGYVMDYFKHIKGK